MPVYVDRCKTHARVTHTLRYLNNLVNTSFAAASVDVHERVILSIDDVRFQHFDVLVGEQLAYVVIGRPVGHVADKDFNRRFALALALGYFDLDRAAYD